MEGWRWRMKLRADHFFDAVSPLLSTLLLNLCRAVDTHRYFYSRASPERHGSSVARGEAAPGRADKKNLGFPMRLLYSWDHLRMVCRVFPWRPGRLPRYRFPWRPSLTSLTSPRRPQRFPLTHRRCPMTYKTIALGLLEANQELHEGLRTSGTLLQTMEHYASELKERHTSWMDTLAQERPGEDR